MNKIIYDLLCIVNSKMLKKVNLATHKDVRAFQGQTK
jgi:hypothetical protein